uniref:HAUS augmin-like complex subunit 1 isoform X1 n=1 Tax=Petromyzon marinus TaxID=7757 RepID=A0AAJ7T2Y0_PETMA|nr:HAUS augmin-like complex subunit 1 isoform X1 [Petromyzon marinus]
MDQKCKESISPSLTVESEIPAKKARQDPQCIIHCSDDNTKLICPQTMESWQTLKRAGEVRKNTMILAITANFTEGQIPNVHYHRKCRSLFTLKRDLDKIASNKSQEGNVLSEERKSAPSSASQVLEKECIFCRKKDKYLKGVKSREQLAQACQLRINSTIRKAAEIKEDSRILALLSCELVAAKAHYHRSCYKSYTKPIKEPRAKPESEDNEDTYTRAESTAFVNLYNFIRNDMFVNNSVMELSELTGMLVGWMNTLGVHNVKPSTKKHIRRKITAEFADSLCMVHTKANTLLVYPDSLTRDQLVLANHELRTEVIALKATGSNVTGSDLSIN